MKALIFICCILLLTSCKTVISSSCPPYPVAGKAVAKEIETVCVKGKCPHITEWLNRIKKLKSQLDKCKTKKLK